MLCWLGPLPATPLTPPDPADVTLGEPTPPPAGLLPALSLGPGLPGGACSLSRHRARPPACSQPLTSPVPCPSPRQPSHLQHAYLEEPLHAEECFLSWFYDTILSPRADYHVTWYISWSPCFECAEKVVNFLEEHENVSLSISASRLYIHDHKDEQGLRHLRRAGAQVAVMSPKSESSGSCGRGSSGDSTRMGAPRIPQEREWKGNLGI